MYSVNLLFHGLLDISAIIAIKAFFYFSLGGSQLFDIKPSGGSGRRSYINMLDNMCFFCFFSFFLFFKEIVNFT